MISLSTALAFFGACLLLAYAPGPDILFVLAQSAVHGPKAGIATTCGLMTGVLWHTAIVAAGLAAIIVASPIAYTCIKVAGALYLLRLAFLSWKAGTVAAASTDVPPYPGFASLFRRGVVMNVTNPKVTLYFLAFLPQFCDAARGSIPAQCLQLGALFILSATIAFTSVSFLAGKILANLRNTQKGQILLNRGCALLFVVLAGTLLFSS